MKGRGAIVGATVLCAAAVGWANRATAVQSRAVQGPQFTTPVYRVQTPMPEPDAQTSAVVMPAVQPALAGRAAAENALAHGDYRGALAQYRDVLAHHPRDAEAAYGAGLALTRLRRFDEARAFFADAVSLNPGRWAYRVALGEAELRLDQYEAAAMQLEAALQLVPDDPDTLVLLARTRLRLGEHESVLAVCDRAQAIAPDRAEPFALRGEAAERLGRYSDAIAAYEEFLRLEPSGNRADAIRSRLAMLRTPVSSTD